MQSQSQREQPKHPHRVLRPQDALVWTILTGLMLLQVLGWVLQDWFTQHKLPSNPMLMVWATGYFFVCLNRFSRVRRGERLKDTLSYPQNASWGWVALGILGMLTCVWGGITLAVTFHPVLPTLLSVLPRCCMMAMALILAGLLGKWTWREYRRARFGDSIEYLEQFTEQTLAEKGQAYQKLRWEGLGFLGIGSVGVLLLVLGILGFRYPTSQDRALITAIIGGIFCLISLGAYAAQKYPELLAKQPEEK